MQTYNPSFQDAEAERESTSSRPARATQRNQVLAQRDGRKGKKGTKQNSYSTVQNTG